MKEIITIVVPSCLGYVVGAFLILFMYKELNPLNCIGEIVARADYKRKSGLPEKPFIKKVRRLNHITNFLMISGMIIGIIGIIGLFALPFI